MKDDPHYTVVHVARKLSAADRRAVVIRWAIVAFYVVMVVYLSRGGTTDAEFVAATIVAAGLVALFLSADWIAGRSWRD